MGITTLQSRGQLTIPVEIRRACGWEPGDSITFSAKPNGVVELRAIKRQNVRDVVRKYSQDGIAPNLDELRQSASDDLIREKLPYESNS